MAYSVMFDQVVFNVLDICISRGLIVYCLLVTQVIIDYIIKATQPKGYEVFATILHGIKLLGFIPSRSLPFRCPNPPAASTATVP